MTSKRVPVPCENCGRELLIRAENLGRIGKCTYCGYLFRAQLHSLFELAGPPPSGSPSPGDAAHAALEPPPISDDPTPTWAAASAEEPSARGAGSDQEDPGSFADRLGHAFSMASLPPPRQRQAPPLGSEESPDSSLVAKQADQLAQLQERIRTGRTELEQVRGRINEERTVAPAPDAAAATEIRAEEFAALRAECQRFREETQVLRSRMEAESAEATLRFEQLARECAAACAERDRLRSERDDRDQKAALARDASDARHADLIQRAEDQQRRFAEVTERLRAAEYLQGRTARDRDARVDEVERLRLRLAALEQSRDAAEAERDEVRAGWEAERRELEAAIQRLRRELRGEAERRLAERQAADHQRQALAAAERRLAEQGARFEARWATSARHFDQLAALWETLAQEVEQMPANQVAAAGPVQSETAAANHQETTPHDSTPDTDPTADDPLGCLTGPLGHA